jgi:protein TonB
LGISLLKQEQSPAVSPSPTPAPTIVFAIPSTPSKQIQLSQIATPKSSPLSQIAAPTASPRFSLKDLELAPTPEKQSQLSLKDLQLTPTPEKQSTLSLKVAPTERPSPKIVPLNKLNVSGGVLQGSAIKKVQPAYPAIAKAAHASGAVQVQVTISEAGQVTEAVAISGHPLLRGAAVEAARQWVFRPTELAGVPVKVQGVLTFNFTLQ